MTSELPQKPKEFITDLNDFDKNERSLHMPASAKNIERLKELSIENLWLIGANDKEIREILPLLNLKYLNLYQVLAKDLTVIEMLDKTETIILNWNTKTTSLWNINKNISLKTLEIIDFSKLEDISQLSFATQVDNLSLGGGHSKPMKIKSLKPLINLEALKS